MWNGQPEDLAHRAIAFGEHWAERGVFDEPERQAIRNAIVQIQEEEMHEGNRWSALKLIYALPCVEADPLPYFASRPSSSPRRRFVEWTRRLLGWRTVPRLEADKRDDPRTELKKSWPDIIRCVFGNPFRPVIFDPAWRTTTAVQLARGMYDSRDFSAIPILADALQDAGCESAPILDHCRGPGPHVRGCWAVDPVLGKE